MVFNKKRDPFPSLFRLPIRVYFEDTDIGGVVYYANYLKFLERCRTEWLRSIGINQSSLLQEKGIAFIVRSVEIEYLKPARMDNLVVVDLSIEKITRSQVFFSQRICLEVADGLEELVRARVQVITVNVNPMKIVSIPIELRAQLEVFK